MLQEADARRKVEEESARRRAAEEVASQIREVMLSVPCVVGSYNT